MKTNQDVVAIHTGSFVDHAAAILTKPMAAEVQEPSNTYRVPTGVDLEEGKPFELTLSGQKVTQLRTWNGTGINGVQVTFEDGTRKQAGKLMHGEGWNVNPDTESITFHPDELVTSTSIYRVENPVEPHNMFAVVALQLQSDFGQKYMAFSSVFIILSMFKKRSPLKSNFDNTRGSLIGVYGIEAPDAVPGKKREMEGLISLGLVLALPEDTEYQFVNVKYDTDAFSPIGDRMLSLKQQLVENDSSATVNSQVSFSHSYSETKSWGNVAGLKAGVKTDIKAGIPFLAEGKVEVSAEGNYEHQWGGNRTDSKTDTWTASITAPPHSHLIARATVTESTISVPFSADLTVRRSDGKTKVVNNVSGVYHGVSLSNLNVKVEDVA